MTRKDYEAIARAFRSAFSRIRDAAQSERGEDDMRAGIEFVLEEIEEILEEDNTRFDRTRFETAARRA